MSRHISDALLILSEIQNLYQGGYDRSPIADLRRDATSIVSTKIKRSITTVHDAITRRLHLKAPQINILLEGWLHNDSSELRDVLERHAQDSEDTENIRRFFTLPLDVKHPIEGLGSESDFQRVSKPSKLTKVRRKSRKPKIAVVLDADVAEVFTNPKMVNEALRGLLKVTRRAAKKISRR